MSSSGRQYDVVLFGATGYTGKLTASYMATHLPTDIKWAISGRSERKLEAVAAVCKGLSSDRAQPAIEICNLDDVEMGDLARKTTVLITTVGPYSMYGEYAFKACAENGTHYIDCTGEVPWVYEMIQKYEKIAKTTGAIMIPQDGVESAPSDLMTWSLVSLIRKDLSAPTASVIISQHEIPPAISGGTAFTALTFLSHNSPSTVAAAFRPYALSPIPGPSTRSSTAPLLTSLLGVRSDPILGLLTTSLLASSNVPIVQRSWGLFGGAKLYGSRFSYEEYMRTRSYARGIAAHFAILGLGLLMLLLAAVPPLQGVVQRLLHVPGEGPSEEEVRTHRGEWRGVAVPDLPAGIVRETSKAYGRSWFEGAIYPLTGLLMVEAAITLLRDDVMAKKFGGGILTPATLGEPYIKRLDAAGFRLEVRMMQD